MTIVIDIHPFHSRNPFYARRSLDKIRQEEREKVRKKSTHKHEPSMAIEH